MIAVAVKPLVRPICRTHSKVCSVSSRVGESTSARGPPSVRSRWMIGRQNAAVLPVPVCAMPITSRPVRQTGIAAAWIGVGRSYFRTARSARISGPNPSSSKRGVAAGDAEAGTAGGAETGTSGLSFKGKAIPRGGRTCRPSGRALRRDRNRRVRAPADVGGAKGTAARTRAVDSTGLRNPANADRGVAAAGERLGPEEARRSRCPVNGSQPRHLGDSLDHRRTRRNAIPTFQVSRAQPVRLERQAAAQNDALFGGGLLFRASTIARMTRRRSSRRRGARRPPSSGRPGPRRSRIGRRPPPPTRPCAAGRTACASRRPATRNGRRRASTRRSPSPSRRSPRPCRRGPRPRPTRASDRCRRGDAPTCIRNPS